LDRIEADLALARHADLVGELETLVAEHPLHERLTQQLMLALYRSGRQADALHVYRKARETLVSELGIEPGRPLRELEAAILRQEASLAPSLPAPQPRVAPAADPVTREVRRTPRIPSSDLVSSTELGTATGERRIVSVLVADVAGSTAIAEKLGPERSKFLFDDVVRLMREEVQRFGGTVAQLTGDGVLALFGAPVAHEDDSERAVRAALAIHEALADYGAQVAPAYGIELGVRVAVNTGPVVVPAGDAPPHVLYNALGDTVNVAARLQAVGDLVVGRSTAQQVGGLFELEELGEFELKGRSKSVAAFRVAGIHAHTAPRPEPPLLGREEELAALSGALEGLLGGRGAIVSITGEPGIGKSRLVAEVGERFAGRVRFLAGHAVAYAETIPYWPVRELLRGWLDLGVSEPEARVRLELRARLARTLADEADEAYPLLATLLGLVLEPEQDERMRALASDAVQRQTFDCFYQLVSALARVGPLCLVLEDLHWSDEATLALVDELLPAVEQNPVAFLLVHRSDPDHPAWQLVDRARRRFRGLFLELGLEPLQDSDAHALAEADAGGELSEELAQLLAERAGGNPYFVGEAILDLRERGALARENGRFVLVGEAAVPGALQEALQARLDRLDPEAHELITTAAVIGRTFGLPLLERLLPRARLLSTLSKLQWLQLVVEERSGAAPEYRFRHGLVQEAAYSTLVEAHRRELHLRVGTRGAPPPRAGGGARASRPPLRRGGRARSARSSTC
jgi:class 3 adenylate cyclase